jgi:uncharacterized membrane protein YcfT
VVVAVAVVAGELEERMKGRHLALREAEEVQLVRLESALVGARLGARLVEVYYAMEEGEVRWAHLYWSTHALGAKAVVKEQEEVPLEPQLLVQPKFVSFGVVAVVSSFLLLPLEVRGLVVGPLVYSLSSRCYLEQCLPHFGVPFASHEQTPS